MENWSNIFFRREIRKNRAVVLFVVREVCMFPGHSEWIIVLLLVVLLFGAKKIPELASGLGKGLKEFKKAKDDVNDELNSPEGNKEISAGKDDKDRSDS